jgi:hypothetical protein
MFLRNFSRLSKTRRCDIPEERIVLYHGNENFMSYAAQYISTSFEKSGKTIE